MTHVIHAESVSPRRDVISGYSNFHEESIVIEGGAQGGGPKRTSRASSTRLQTDIIIQYGEMTRIEGGRYGVWTFKIQSVVFLLTSVGDPRLRGTMNMQNSRCRSHEPYPTVRPGPRPMFHAFRCPSYHRVVQFGRGTVEQCRRLSRSLGAV